MITFEDGNVSNVYQGMFTVAELYGMEVHYINDTLVLAVLGTLEIPSS